MTQSYNKKGFSVSLLTDSQKQAVFHKDGPLLILAGPGSGKTRVITCRIAALIDSGVAPWNICAITFTNKASEEMKQRVVDMGTPPGAQISTFHSLCVRILRQFSQQANIDSNFSIYSDADQKKCIKDAIKAIDKSTTNFPPARVLDAISKFKNKLVTPEQALLLADNFYEENVAKIYESYQKALESNQAMDFDDLLVKTAFLLRDNLEVRTTLNNRFKYIMVDEYQDTNHCQYEMAKLLAIEHENICVTGDPDQSIYRWRGADISNILAFERDWPTAKVIKLEENFRSSPKILELADKLISANTQRKDKRLIPFKTESKDISVNRYETEEFEAQGVAADVKKLIEDGADLNEIAVFYRVNSMSRAVEEAFIESQIPYMIVRGVEFYSRKEIRDMMAYLKLVANPADDVALSRIINTPARGIGKTSLTRLEDYAKTHNLNLYDAASRAAFINTISPAAQGKISKFVSLVENFKRAASKEPFNMEKFMETVYKDSGLSNSFTSGKTPDDSAVENVNELINAAAKYDEQSEQPTLNDYLQTVALYSDSDAYDPESGCVSLMTLHAAKGLEFENVFLIGLEEGLLPHDRSKDNPEELEEERRLFFVGITRAKMGLSINHARYRTIHGQMNRTTPSQFLYETDLINEDDSEDTQQDSFDNPFGIDVNSWSKRLEKNRGSSDDTTNAGSNYNRNSYNTNNYSRQNNRPSYQSTRKPKSKPDFLPSTPKKKGGISEGTIVKHPTFGFGTIKEYLDLGENSVITVRFNSGKTKTLLKKFAKLEIMS